MIYKLSDDKLNEFFTAISDGRTVYAPEQTDNRYHIVRADTWDPKNHVLGDYRPVEPLKSLVFKPRESLGLVMKDSEMPAVEERIVIGVKNCDVSALRIHDQVFLKTEPVDPYYKELREKTVIVSCDCSDAYDVCFCTAVNEQPYPKKGFDINISKTDSGYVVETGSERGEQIAASARDILSPAGDAIIQKRDANREALYKKVAEQTAERGLGSGHDFKQAIQKSGESDLWERFAEDCVECGACNFSCCTCHCFLLADGVDENNEIRRVKQWDSCLYRNFARVGGGANPRKHRAERLYNRFDKKFNYFPTVLERYACDGCGRCIEACTGKIDIRDVLKKVLDEG